jgi:hypothetical protein
VSLVNVHRESYLQTRINIREKTEKLGEDRSGEYWRRKKRRGGEKYSMHH